MYVVCVYSKCYCNYLVISVASRRQCVAETTAKSERVASKKTQRLHNDCVRNCVCVIVCVWSAQRIGQIEFLAKFQGAHTETLTAAQMSPAKRKRNGLASPSKERPYINAYPHAKMRACMHACIYMCPCLGVCMYKCVCKLCKYVDVYACMQEQICKFVRVY